MRHHLASLACLTAFVGLFTGCDDSSTDSTGSNPLPGTTTGGMQTATSGMGGAGGAMGGAGGMMSTSGASMTTSTSSTTSSSSSTGSGMGGGCSGGEPTIVTSGSNTKILLQGTVLTPTGPISGEVLINGNTIACVAADCSAMASGATVVDTHGVISPGLIDAHNHILFDIFDETDWEPPHDGPGGTLHAYGNHDQWGSAPGYSQMVDCKQALNGEGASPFNLGCELDKFGEMKGLVAGTTSIQASAGTNSCQGSLSRTIGTSSNDFGVDKCQTATLFPSTSTADTACSNIATDKTDAYVIHVAEGVDNTAHNEFMKLFTISTVDGCLYAPETTIIHGTALNSTDFATMATHQMQLVWSPRSNVFLYGSGTDLAKTTDIQAAMQAGINVSIAPDWSMGGSQNMLDEMRYADYVDDNRWGNMLSPQDIWEMATINPARALHIDQFVGSIAVGKRADLVVFVGDAGTPFDTILDATPREVSMVFVDGRFLYGDSGLEGALQPPSSTCEALDICCRPKVACIAETTGTPTNKLAQTYAQFKAILDQAIVDYDASTPAGDPKFAPITPLVRCP